MRISDWSSDVCSSDLREEIIAYAREFDPQPFHLSDEGAAATHFGTLSSSGWHTTALSMKMMLAAWETRPGPRPAALGAIGVDELRWLNPVHAGDTLRGTSKVIEKKASRSRPEMGIVKRSEEHTSELTSLMRISYAVFCLN